MLGFPIQNELGDLITTTVIHITAHMTYQCNRTKNISPETFHESEKKIQ